MRKRLYQILAVAGEQDQLSIAYDIWMILVIITSIVPLTIKEQTPVFVWMDRIAVCFLVIDYLLRLATADYKLKKRGWRAFFEYPFTPMALVDLFSILPSVTFLSNSWKLLKFFKLFRVLRVLRLFNLVRYSRMIIRIRGIFRRQKRALICVAMGAAVYTLITALILFQVEPDLFSNFFDAFYWAVVSLFRMGDGGIHPVSVIGRLLVMLSSLVGIFAIALPVGIITAGFINEP